MAFYISPSVNIFESDFQSLSVVQIADYIGGTAGFAPWGPAAVPTMITGGESEFVTVFHKPDTATYLDMLTAIDFLSYSSKMWYVRAIGVNAKNAVATGGAPILVRNEDEIDNGSYPGHTVVARYPGSLGNGLILDVADAARFATWEYASAFEYTPGEGEFAVAVVDGSGKFSGQGRTKQRESVGIYGVVDAAPQSEHRSVEFSGGPVTQSPKASLWTLSISGNGSVPVGNVNVPFMAGEVATDVYFRIADAMRLQPENFLEPSASWEGVMAVDFTNSSTTPDTVDLGNGNELHRNPTAGVALNYINVAVEGTVLRLNTGTTALQAATQLATALATNSKVKDIVQTTDTVMYTLVAVGVQPAVPAAFTRGDITVTPALVSPGTPGNRVIQVFGVNVLVSAEQTTADIAAAVATALAADTDFAAEYDNIKAERTTVVFTHKDPGQYPLLTAPATQYGLEFSYGVSVAGQLGTMLERYELQTTVPGAKFADGTNKNIFDTLRQTSRYVFWADRTQPFTAGTIELEGGVDDYSVSKESFIKQLDNGETVDVNYIWIAGNVGEQKALADVVETRRDVVGHISPQMRDVVNNKGREAQAVRDWRINQVNRDSTYLFSTDNWALVYDKYSDIDRWIPICGGTAGLQARAAVQFYPWTNFSGHQRGLYKNYKRMAWSANKEARDTLYKVGVNSSVTFPGEGVVLYGDKMSTQRPSSFSRVNTRMAFIIAEKSLANFSRQYLFELNDAYTRNQWLNAARPFLRNMQAGRAFEEFQLICDDRNNGPDIRSENRMVGHIRIRPLYSINWIDLHFDAVRPGIEFDEVEILV